jgi:hypothetical protein
MAKISSEIMELIKDQESTKIVATANKDGVSNVTVKGSLMIIDDETLVFADLYGSKSRTFNNLMDTKKMSVLVFKAPMKPPFPTYQIKGTLADYQTSGSTFEQFAKVIKDAIGADIVGVGIVKVDGVYSQAPQDAGKQIS